MFPRQDKYTPCTRKSRSLISSLLAILARKALNLMTSSEWELFFHPWQYVTSSTGPAAAMSLICFSQCRCWLKSMKSPRSSNSTNEHEIALPFPVLPSIYQLFDLGFVLGSNPIGMPSTTAFDDTKEASVAATSSTSKPGTARMIIHSTRWEQTIIESPGTFGSTADFSAQLLVHPRLLIKRINYFDFGRDGVEGGPRDRFLF